MLKERTSEYGKSLREKWEKMPQSVKEYMRNLVFYDKKIRSNIGFRRLKKLYCKGKISEADLLNRYKEEAEKVGLFDYINKLMAQSNVLLSSESANKSTRTSIKSAKVGAAPRGLHHDELNQLRRGNVMVCISTSDSSAGSSSGDSTSSSGGDFGHAAIWVQDGDPERYNWRSHVAMSSWNDPWNFSYEEAPHELKYEVGYDFRQFWSGKLVPKDGVIYGMNVRKWISTGWWWSGYWKIVSNAEANAAAQYAENQRKKPYPPDINILGIIVPNVATTKLNTNTFYCSSLVWRSWYEQGIDLDSKRWPLNLWFITPSDIYGDNNVVMKFSYLGIK